MTNGYFWGLPERVLEDYNILKASDNIKMAWEKVTVLCMKGVWHKIWPSNENCGTNCAEQLTLQFFFMFSEPQPGPSSAK